MSSKAKKAAGAASPPPPVSPSPASPVSGDEEDDAGSWNVVKDDRKLRYDKVQAKRKQEALEEAKRKSDADTAAKLEKELKGEAEASEPEEKVAKNKGPVRTPKKKSNKSQFLNISTEKQLIEAITGILNNVPNGHHIHLSVIGNRLHEMTNHSWSSKFAKTYGALPKFFADRPKLFHVTPDQLVYLKAEWDHARASSDPLAAPKKKKSERKDGAASPVASAKNPKAAAAAAAANINAVGKKRRRRDGSDEADDEEGGNTLRIVFVALLVIVVMLFTFVALEGVSFQQFVDRVKASFK